MTPFTRMRIVAPPDVRYGPLPDDNGGADITLVGVGDDGKPVCREHGAMNRVSAEGYWRCIALAGPKRNPCRAGCATVSASANTGG